MCWKTHALDCAFFSQQEWSHCQDCESERRSWPRSEMIGYWVLEPWRSSSLCSARVGAGGGHDCWGISLPSEPSRQKSKATKKHTKKKNQTLKKKKNIRTILFCYLNILPLEHLYIYKLLYKTRQDCNIENRTK